ncbi:hypothetical protein K7X08_026292 [Anisodus acutangulus]|uniref:Uncharacterized protein n=1 Tax=Anisodus acutangulus TaxID=402998 RepID=A0A9Q1R2T5_9SOLA|nr:hypothetical protein K7X08_026292 [Anisodus acutangulus]
METHDNQSATSLVIELVSDEETDELLQFKIRKIDKKIELTREKLKEVDYKTNVANAKMKEVDEILEFVELLTEKSLEGKSQYQNLFEEVQTIMDIYIPPTQPPKDDLMPYGEESGEHDGVVPTTNEAANEYGIPQGPSRELSPMWWAISLNVSGSYFRVALREVRNIEVFDRIKAIGWAKTSPKVLLTSTPLFAHKSCLYHKNHPDHDMDECVALKKRVVRLIDQKSFDIYGDLTLYWSKTLLYARCRNHPGHTALALQLYYF